MRTILIADDDQTHRDSMRMVLERAGYAVEGAADVDSALAALDSRRFDMVLCDYRMPGKSGIDLLEELHRRDSTVPVLMISACADDLTASKAMELGALGVLKKPIRRQELIDRAAEAMAETQGPGLASESNEEVVRS
jgi:DNA-binding NtrC family response regulator